MSATNTDFQLNLTSTLQNPGGSFRVSAHDDQFPTEGFDQSEAQLFEEQMNSLIAGVTSQEIASVLQNRQQTIAKAAGLAKDDIDGNNFGGLNAGDNEIGFSPLRPGHIRRDPNSGNVINDWFFDPGATGYTDWIGDGSGNNMVLNGDQVVLVLGVVDQEASPTPIQGFNVQDFGRNMDMLPRDLNDLRLQDNSTEVQVKEIETLIGQEGDEIHCRLNFDENVERQPRLLGFTFAKGRFLNQESYSTADYDNF